MKPNALIILALTLSGGPVLAQTEPVQNPLTPLNPQEMEVYADRLESVDNVLTATGRVVVLYRDLTLNADFLQFDQETRDGLAEGSVTLTQDGSSVRTDRLSFNLEKRTAEVGSFAGILKNEGRFRGNSLSISPSLLKATGTTFIPCLSGDPYLLRSRAVLYYPDQSDANLVLDRVSLEVKKLPILVLPTLAWTVGKGTGRRNLLDMVPQMGYNAYEGIYAQGTTPYRLSPNSYGSVPLRYSTNRGVTAGIEHVYTLSPQDEARGNASYQTPWAPGQGGIRANLVGRHYFPGGGDLETAAGYRSEINTMAVSRLEFTSHSPMWYLGNYRTIFQGNLGAYQEDSFLGLTSSPRALVRQDGWYPLSLGGGNLSLYEWANAAQYQHEHYFTSLAGARWDREYKLLDGFVGTDLHRVQGSTPFLFDRTYPFNRLYGGLGLWVHQNWRLAADISYSQLLPTSYSASDMKWSMSDFGLGLDFNSPCIGWQLRLQPLIFGFTFSYQLTKF